MKAGHVLTCALQDYSECNVREENLFLYPLLAGLRIKLA